MTRVLEMLRSPGSAWYKALSHDGELLTGEGKVSVCRKCDVEFVRRSRKGKVPQRGCDVTCDCA